MEKKYLSINKLIVSLLSGTNVVWCLRKRASLVSETNVQFSVKEEKGHTFVSGRNGVWCLKERASIVSKTNVAW